MSRYLGKYKSQKNESEQHPAWFDKNLALSTESINVLKRLSKHNDEFVRLAVTLNIKFSNNKKRKSSIESYKQILIDIARTDPVISIRDSAIAKILKLKRDI